jgi:hypothetical protein
MLAGASMTEGLIRFSLARHYAARQRELFPLELGCKHLDGCRQHAHTFGCDVHAALFDDALIAIAEGMRHHDDGEAHVSYSFTHHLCERRESRTDHGDGRDTEIFERGRVTRGPGRR